MRFDYTKGDSAKYMVNIHRAAGSDQYYFHWFRDAKNFFDRVALTEKNARISLYDISKDIRKSFAKV